MYSAFTPAHRGGSGPPLVCLHGFTDTWRTWDLVLPALQRQHDVLATTLAGHAGGPKIQPGEASERTLVDAVERAMDEAGFATAHVAGNSLGGYVALQLAARGRAESVVAFAPAGGWAADDDSFREVLDHFTALQAQARAAAPHAGAMAATAEGRRRMTQFVAERYEHLPAELVAHLLQGAAGCTAATDLIAYAHEHGWPLDAARIDCPVRVVWGTNDRLLSWPQAAVRYKNDWLPHADWIELDDVGHCPQLDVPLEAAQLILGLTVR